MARHGDRPLGIALAGLGALAAAAALSIGGWDGAEWGARTVPLLASATIALSGAAIAFRPAPFGTAGAAEPDPRGAGERRESRAFVLLGLAVLYLLAIERVGFLVATAFAAPAAFALFGVRRPLSLVIAALLLPLALHLAFFRLLGVFPPLGAWFDLLDHVPL